MENRLFVTATEVATELGVSKPYAYKLIRQMNDELKVNGYVIIPGKLSRKFYEEKFYGMSKEKPEGADSYASIQR